MKKLLSLLTITTLTTSVPAPLMAAAPATRDVGMTAKDVTTGFNIKIKEKWNKDNMINISPEDKAFEQLDNKWYIVVWKTYKKSNWRITKFKNDTPTTKSNGRRTIVSEEDKDKLFILMETTELAGEKFKKYPKDITVGYTESYNYFTWKFSQPASDKAFKNVYRWDGVGEPNLPEINSSTGEITDWKQPIQNDFQKGILFSLAENNKTATWSNAGMRLTVDGETNININNSNVEEVYWDGAKQNILEHKVKINVKPETSEKTHKLVIKYDINGTKYTSEDIDIVMAAKIEPPKPIVKENLSDVIKFVNNNDLGNILDSIDDTIKAAITQKNSRKVDFSQIKITDKTDTQATLSAIEGSKSYQGSVIVKYNVVPATTVDLKIDLTSSASGVQIDSDYLVQLDSSKMTNKVDTFYYANGKSTIKIKQPSTGNVITGKIYGCDEQWNKTSQSNTINPTSGLEIDKGQYGSVDGRYLIELQHQDLPTHNKTIYLQVSQKQKGEHYWDTDNGKQFEQWADDNGEKNIRGSSASQLNNLFEVSKTWKQSLTHLALKLDNFVVDNIQNVMPGEIDNYKTKMLASVKAQVEKYAPDVVENTDYKILVDNLVAGDWTTSKDVKVQAVDGSTKLLSFDSKTIPVQQKEQPIPPTPDNEKDGDSKLWIIGVVVGVLAGLGIAYLLFKRFVFDKYIYPKIIARRHNKLVEQIKKEEAEKDAQNNKGGEK